jgi:hypothetical protein
VWQQGMLAKSKVQASSADGQPLIDIRSSKVDEPISHVNGQDMVQLLMKVRMLEVLSVFFKVWIQRIYSRLSTFARKEPGLPLQRKSKEIAMMNSKEAEEMFTSKNLVHEQPKSMPACRWRKRERARLTQAMTCR